MTALSVETIEHLDFDHSVPCDGDAYGKLCDEPATYRWQTTCCGAVFVLCTLHSEEEVAFVIRKLLKSGVICEACEHFFKTGLLVSDVVAITTIK